MLILVVLITVGVLLVLQAVTSDWFFKSQPYNSYILQAQSWLEGRLDLGKDYPYLELAIFEGKYFVSFPPFPSYLMLPFVALGWNSCDGFIALVFAIVGAIYAYKLADEFIKNQPISLILALLVTIGSNWLFTSINAWVWFIAQSMAFTLTMSAFYYALKGKAGLSFALWACAVGCRPFQIIYIAVILYLLYSNYKKDGQKLPDMIKNHILSVIPACIIAISYMILNYMRFGSIVEFGHNYLPEFMRVSTGQFNIEYIKANFVNLFRLPMVTEKGLEFQSANGFCMFIASPILISVFIYWIIGMIKGNKEDRICLGAVMLLFWIHMLSITAHKTMGGAHYGNRYVNDALPSMYMALCCIVSKYSKAAWLNIIPLFAGLVLNCLWVVMFYV